MSRLKVSHAATIVAIATIGMAAGRPAAAAISGYERVESSKKETIGPGLAAGISIAHSVACPPGKVVLSGGATVDEGIRVELKATYPGSDTSWSAVFANVTSAPVSPTVTVYAVCADR
jgi:hypothetical protein